MPLSRRTFLQAAGVGLALPLLDASLPRGVRAAEAVPPMRLVTLCSSLGIHAPYLFPEKPGEDYGSTPYLELLKEHKSDFTLFSGLSHPDQSGADGHSSESTWLTSAKHPGLGGFRNTVSLDQLVAERIGIETRFPSLQLGTSGSSQSYTRSGVMIPSETRPSKLFAKLFLEGTPQEVEAQMAELREGRSILDTVRAAANKLQKRVGTADKEKLEEYFTSVREMEIRLSKAEEWARKPKPRVEASQPQDVADERDLIARMKLLCDLVPLALQTDSTRLITILVQGRNDVPPVPGVSIDHHNLSHHGQDAERIRQLKLIEEAELKIVAGLLAALKAKQEAGKTLLERTMVLCGSNLGNANSHDTRNLPILVAGGGFRHGRYIAYDAERNLPLSNLFLQMLHKLGHPEPSFGSSTANQLPGFA